MALKTSKASTVGVTNENTGIGELDTHSREPSSAIITEDVIRENMVRHRQAIIDCLNPSQLFDLYTNFDLDEIPIDRSKLRSEKATILYEEVLKRGACREFFSSLEEDTEHMGHRYIVSLLRGTQFAGEEEIRESKKLREQVQSKSRVVITVLDVPGITPQLIEEQLITRDELEELQSPQNTKQKRATILLALLKTKGPTAYSTFFKCLEADNDLCKLLTDTHSRKRKLNEEFTKITKRVPCLLKVPKGLCSQHYLETIRAVREEQQFGGDRWKIVNDMCEKEMSSLNTPLEIKAALLLEITITLIHQRRSEEEIFSRVEQARQMCLELSRNQCNAQVLEGRCEYVLMRYYKAQGNYEEAQRHLDTFFRFIVNCEPGEDMLIANYIQGVMLIQRDRKSDLDREKGVGYLRYAISLASEQDYGYKTLQYGSIRLAQAQIGSSSLNPGKPREEVSSKNIEDAMTVLKAMNEVKDDLPLRTKCMYLCTLSDVYRLDGQLKEAMKHVKMAIQIEQAHNLTETEPTKIRMRQLEKCLENMHMDSTSST